MRTRSLSAILALWAGFAAACTPKPAEQAAAPPAVDSAAVRTAVADLWQRWAVADTAGNIDALVGMVGDSARMDVKGMPPILGTAAWRTFAEAGYKSTKYTSLSITPYQTTAISSELAYESGSYAEGSTTGGKPVMDRGRYAGAIRKYPDGQWRIAYLMVMSDSLVPVKK
jgi:ketosteroid isomerase-like protein